MIKLLLICALLAVPFHETCALEKPQEPIDITDDGPYYYYDHNSESYLCYPTESVTNPPSHNGYTASGTNSRSSMTDEGSRAFPYYVPDGSIEHPYSYNVESSDDSACPEYEKYPGVAYENSVSTVKIITTIVVGSIFVAVVIIALTNTPKGCHSGHNKRSHHHHHHHSHN